MKQTIIDLWNGNIAPCEACSSRDMEGKHLISLMEHNREALSAGQSVNQMETLQKYIDCAEEYLLRMLELSFADGFSLGCRLVMESVAD